MVCRGGKTMEIDQHLRIFNTKPDTGYATGLVEYTFKRGTGAAGLDGSGLGAGECAWVDRGLRASEPTRIVDEAPGVVTLVHKRKAGAAPVLEVTSFYNNLHEGGDARYLTVWVYNVGASFKRDPTKPIKLL